LSAASGMSYMPATLAATKNAKNNAP